MEGSSVIRGVAPPQVKDPLIHAARQLLAASRRLTFGSPVTHTYNPLEYAWEAHSSYLKRYGAAPKKAVFLGMNPGPFGMVQTGVPFGEVAAVRDWLKIECELGRIRQEHPNRPIQGLQCARSEVSGRRLWGLFAQRFGSADRFFADFFVLNYCPLAFMESSGRNLTPDKLRREEAAKLFEVCDCHLKLAIRALQPKCVIGIGEFAEKRARIVLSGLPIRIERIPHPSPASPAANRDWAGQATRRLVELGIW